MRFEDELRAILDHELEQNEFIHNALASPGQHMVPIEDVVMALAQLHAIHTDLLLRRASEIDNLRAAINGA